MKKIISKTVNYNGHPTTLNIIEHTGSRELDMPKDDLGYYVGADNQLYLPVFIYNNIFLNPTTIRDCIWHAIRNVQRKCGENERDTPIFWTRLLYQMHTVLVGEDRYDEKLVKTLCTNEGLTLLQDVIKEPQVPYKADDSRFIVDVSGIKLNRLDIITALRQAGFWFCWESRQPDQKYRESLLVHDAVVAFYASFALGNPVKKYIPELIFEWVNEGRQETDQVIPMKTIKKIMRSIEIPANNKQCA